VNSRTLLPGSNSNKGFGPLCPFFYLHSRPDCEISTLAIRLRINHSLDCKAKLLLHEFPLGSYPAANVGIALSVHVGHHRPGTAKFHRYEFMNTTTDELDVAQSANLTDVAMCINHYRLSTPGLHVCIHVPVQINRSTRVIPGLIVQVGNGKFNQCNPVDYDHFSGPPNFVFDVFRDEQRGTYDSRRELYEQNGVIEYVAWFNSSKLPIWNRLAKSKYREIEEDEDGLIKSTALPGLWIPTKSWAERDMWSIMAKISHGITRRGHRDFMATIWRD